MQLLALDEGSQQSLLDLPETGMGFQLVEATVWGDVKPFLVLNAERAVDLSSLDLAPSDEPAIVLRNGLMIVALMKDVVAHTAVMTPQPASFRVLTSRVPAGAPGVSQASSPGVRATLPSSLVKGVTLTATRPFHRFSAFRPDRRVNPTTGDFAAGTYACPASEVPFVPTGFAAVGRFALPNTLPASFHYEIEAPVGTSVLFGTVAPAFGQAGGGVEAYFASAVVNAAATPTAHPNLPDE